MSRPKGSKNKPKSSSSSSDDKVLHSVSTTSALLANPKTTTDRHMARVANGCRDMAMPNNPAQTTAMPERKGWTPNPVITDNEPKGCTKCGSIHRDILHSNERPELGLVWRRCKCLDCQQIYMLRSKLQAKSPEHYEKMKSLQSNKPPIKDL